MCRIMVRIIRVIFRFDEDQEIVEDALFNVEGPGYVELHHNVHTEIE